MRSQRVLVTCGVVVVVLALLICTAAVGCEDLGAGGGGATTVTEVATTGAPDGSSSTEGGTSSTGAPSSATTAAATTPTTAALSSAETLLPSGHIKAAGIIDDAWEDASGRHLRIDYVDMLTWDEAVAAGMVDPAEPYDGIWYSNVNPMLREFDVSDPVEIFTSYRGYHVDFDVPCTWTDFTGFWSSSPPPGDEYMHDELWWIERDGDTVIWISQQYTS